MSYTHRRLYSLHAENLFKLPDNLDSLSVSEHPQFKNILNNTLETAEERNERDDYYKKDIIKSTTNYNMYTMIIFLKCTTSWKNVLNHQKKVSFLHMELLNPVKNQCYNSQTKLVIV